MGEVILVVLAIFGLLLLVAIGTFIAIMIGFLIKAVAPGINRLLLSIVSTGVVPAGWLALLLVVVLATVDEDFRGPEVLGFAILFAVAIFLVVIIWPASLFLTYRFFRNR